MKINKYQKHYRKSKIFYFSVAKKYYSRRDGNSEVPAVVNKYQSEEEVDFFEEEDEDDDWNWDD